MPSGRNHQYMDDSPKPLCIDMCETAFANTTGEFEWVAAGVLTELRAVIITLEASIDVMALDAHFAKVTDAVASKLAPLSAQADALAAYHADKLAKLQKLQSAKAAAEAAAASGADHVSILGAGSKKPLAVPDADDAPPDDSEAAAVRRSLAEMEDAAEHKTTWEEAREPLRIELTTLGTTIAFVLGMVLANAAHGSAGPGAGGAGGYGAKTQGGSDLLDRRYAPPAEEASGLVSGAGASAGRSYGAFE